MGSGIAQVAAQSGAKVILFDADKQALDKAKLTLGSGLKKLEEKGKIPRDEGKKIMDRIQFATSMSEFASCGLVIEAIIENLGIKQKVFAELEKIVHANTILASNTSSLSIASIGASCKEPGRVVGIHFFNPAQLMPLVEVIPAITTSPGITTVAAELVRKWGKLPVVARDTPGFIVNRVARSFYGESIRIYEEGIADFATIDWAMKTFGGFRMGPFELMDFIGNDINYKVTESVWEQFFYEPRFKPSLTQKRLYEAKLYGRKSGKGYYDYAEDAVMPEPGKDEALGKQIFNRVLVMLINEAVDAHYLRLASKEDIDLAMTKGVSYPKGLLKWCDELGASNVLNSLNELYDEYQEDRYRPSLLLKKMVREKKKFYE
jgi:3-hydroxybutyryl-CoA dehydrogenase